MSLKTAPAGLPEGIEAFRIENGQIAAAAPCAVQEAA